MVRTLHAVQLTTTRAGLGEGPVWDDTIGELRWVDITGSNLMRTEPSTGRTSVESVASMPGSLFLTEDDQVLTARPAGIVVDETLLVDFDHADERVRANDGKVDPNGRIVVGTMGLDAEPGLGSLYRVDLRARRCERLLTGLTIANGMAWADGGETFYFIDSPTQRVMRYHYPSLGSGETFVEIAPDIGTPDGMTIDADGHLWVALWGGGAVHRIGPDGVLDAIVMVPTPNVTCCTFGGPTLDQLFITTAAPDRQDDGIGGSLFICDVGVRGVAAQRVAADR